jgi:hypothetical protein
MTLGAENVEMLFNLDLYSKLPVLRIVEADV